MAYTGYIDKTYILTKINQAELNALTGSTDDNLETAIKEADDFINSYLQNAVKVVPIEADKLPASVQQCSFTLTMFYLHDRTQFNDIPQRIKDKYDAAVNWLKDVAAGKANVGVLSGEAELNYYSESTTEVNQMGRDSI